MVPITDLIDGERLLDVEAERLWDVAAEHILDIEAEHLLDAGCDVRQCLPEELLAKPWVSQQHW